MDYQRIYGEFIADRRANPPGADEYVEVHHILPRCLGGTNAKQNLIRLRPEDHFFAHLLLARIHGTLEMLAVVVLYSNRKGGIYLRAKAARHKYGWARRRYAEVLAERMRGENHPRHDPAQHTFLRKDGTRFQGTRVQFCAQFGVSGSALASVFGGRIRSLQGWFLEGVDPRLVGRGGGRFKDPRCDHSVREFVNLDGRRFKGTRYEFADDVGLSTGDVSRITSGGLRTLKGWFLAENESQLVTLDTGGRPPRVGFAKGSSRDSDIHEFAHVDGRTFRGTKWQLADHAGIPVRGFHYVCNGRRLQFNGWRLAATPLESVVPRAGAKHHLYNPAIYTFQRIEDGLIVKSTQHDLCVRYGGDVRNVSAMIKGRRKAAYGWRLATTSP